MVECNDLSRRVLENSGRNVSYGEEPSTTKCKGESNQSQISFGINRICITSFIELGLTVCHKANSDETKNHACDFDWQDWFAVDDQAENRDPESVSLEDNHDE